MELKDILCMSISGLSYMKSQNNNHLQAHCKCCEFLAEISTVFVKKN